MTRSALAFPHLRARAFYTLIRPLKISILERTTRKAVTTAGRTLGEFPGSTSPACYLPYESLNLRYHPKPAFASGARRSDSFTASCHFSTTDWPLQCPAQSIPCGDLQKHTIPLTLAQPLCHILNQTGEINPRPALPDSSDAAVRKSRSTILSRPKVGFQ